MTCATSFDNVHCACCAEFKKLQAQCSALRETIEYAVDSVPDMHDEHRDRFMDVLYTDAGTELLGRLRLVESNYSRAINMINGPCGWREERDTLKKMTAELQRSYNVAVVRMERAEQHVEDLKSDLRALEAMLSNV